MPSSATDAAGPTDAAADVRERYGPLVGFDAAMGFVLTEAGPDRVVITWTVGPQNVQPYGIVHGGTYAGAVETAASWGAALWWAERGQVVGVSNSTDFLRAVTEGTLTATATPIHRGRSQQLWQVVITDEQDRLVARGQVRLHNLSTNRAVGTTDGPPTH